MKIAAAVLVSVSAFASGSEMSPLEKTVQLLADLETKVIKEGETAQSEYEEYSEWCEDRSKELGFEIKTGKASVEGLKATILQETSLSEGLDAKLDDLAADISKDEADLKAATEIRDKEFADFSAEEKELSSTIDMIQRAITVIENETGGAALLQQQGATNLQQALEIMVKASAISAADGSKLTSLAQTSQASDDDDSDADTGAPAAEVYGSHSGGIIDTLTALLDKANAQLTDAQSTETNNKNNYDQLKQSLTDDIKYANKDKNDATKGLATSAETKAIAEGDLSVTSKDLAEDNNALGELHADCMAKAQNFEAETKSRSDELTALAQAKKAIVTMSSGAGGQVYFIQLNRISSGADFDPVHYVRQLARKQKSPALAQLASRMSTAMTLGARVGDDPFGKIKGLISDMLDKLQKEADDAADLKDWCDKEFAESRAKKEDATADHQKLTTKMDSASAQSEQLKEDVSTLQKELAELASTQSQMDNLRAEEKATYEVDRPELEMGLKGVKLALKILNDYYSKNSDHESSEGAAGGIIGMLEVIESDFSKNLAEVVATEQSAADTYDRETKENAVEKTTKDQDVKYKTKTFHGLDKSLTELTADREGVQTELDAVNEYLESLEKKCTYKVETYAERVARRQAEIDGLKDALDTLENETAFIQKSSTLRSLRGIKRRA